MLRKLSTVWNKAINSYFRVNLSKESTEILAFSLVFWVLTLMAISILVKLG